MMFGGGVGGGRTTKSSSPPANHKTKPNTMYAVVAARRTVAPIARCRQQRRGIVDWMTNYPDKVSYISGGGVKPSVRSSRYKKDRNERFAGFSAWKRVDAILVGF